MDQTIAWIIVVIGFVLPLLHVALSPNGGAWRAPENCRCPFGPRIGWIIIVVMLGPIGWVMFMLSRRQKEARNGSSIEGNQP